MAGRPKSIDLTMYDLVEAHGPISAGWIRHLLGRSNLGSDPTLDRFIKYGIMRTFFVTGEEGRRVRMVELVPVEEWACSMPRRVICVPANQWKADPVKAPTSVFDLAEVL